MPVRVANASIVVMRDGKRVNVPGGAPYNFTEKEIEDVNNMQPGTFRKPIMELTTASLIEASQEEVDEVETTRNNAAPKPPKAKAKAKAKATDDDI